MGALTMFNQLKNAGLTVALLNAKGDVEQSTLHITSPSNRLLARLRDNARVFMSEIGEECNLIEINTDSKQIFLIPFKDNSLIAIFAEKSNSAKVLDIMKKLNIE